MLAIALSLNIAGLLLWALPVSAAPADLVLRGDNSTLGFGNSTFGNGTWANFTMPAHCTTKLFNTTSTHSCYTATTTVLPSGCPALHCPEITSLVCPAIASVTSIYVPCKTDCCPVTPTSTVTGTCHGCGTTCVVPTETETVTTACPVTATLTVLATATVTKDSA